MTPCPFALKKRITSLVLSLGSRIVKVPEVVNETLKLSWPAAHKW
jgi:hypothetical protein